MRGHKEEGVYVISLMMLLSSWSERRERWGRTLFKARHWPSSMFWYEGEV